MVGFLDEPAVGGVRAAAARALPNKETEDAPPLFRLVYRNIEPNADFSAVMSGQHSDATSRRNCITM